MTYSLQRGQIPSWVRELKAPGYTNIFEICSPDVLYGTERLCGDWDGQLLVVAKDFAPADEVARLVAAGYGADMVYRHNDGDGRYKTGLRTNKRLMKLLFGADAIVTGTRAANCGVLYASASYLLKHGTTSSDLKDWEPQSPARRAGRLVLQHTIENMPKLKAVACLGSDALSLLSEIYAFQIPTRISDAVGKRFGTVVPIYVAPHPSRGSNEVHKIAWEFIRTDAKLI